MRALTLPVRDRSGEILYYVGGKAAQRMLDRGRVIALGTKTTIHALQVAPAFDDSKVVTLAAYLGQRYSHKRETTVNPPGCWTLKRVSKKDRTVFRRVLLDCLAA